MTENTNIVVQIGFYSNRIGIESRMQRCTKKSKDTITSHCSYQPRKDAEKKAGT